MASCPRLTAVRATISRARAAETFTEARASRAAAIAGVGAAGPPVRAGRYRQAWSVQRGFSRHSLAAAAAGAEQRARPPEWSERRESSRSRRVTARVRLVVA